MRSLRMFGVLNTEYEFSITLPRHPEQINTRDPRKVWMYECISGKFSTQPDRFGSTIIYFFEKESDLMLFQLKWEYK